ncbi:MAG TPA: gluconeogenesis factor YvcK family protein [Candidatus Methylomirabilis sp.]|nr:gluconeogenesis factor YvcK family protein [Candidatus Methylomirabilis sp.]
MSKPGRVQEYGPRRQLGAAFRGRRGWQQREGSTSRHPRIVALGGGTGLPVLLRGLKAALFPPGWAWVSERDAECLTAVVTAADDGGSSGRLRRDYAVPPPGDLRNCLLALSDADPTMAAIFAFRFEGTGEVAGHSLGNLILTALSQLERDGFLGALKQGSDLLRIRGRVLPSTLEPVILRAEFIDGSEAEGESCIAAARRLINRVVLQPNGARLLPEALRAVETADLVVIGPGSLYTSQIATLLVDDLAEAITRSRARVILVMNLMTEPGETDGYTAVDHVLAIHRHALDMPIDGVVLNTAPIPQHLIQLYAAQGATPVPSDAQLLRALGYRLLERDLLDTGPVVRHDPGKVARAVLDFDSEVPA